MIMQSRRNPNSSQGRKNLEGCIEMTSFIVGSNVHLRGIDANMQQKPPSQPESRLMKKQLLKVLKNTNNTYK